MNLLKVWQARNQIREGILNRIFTKEHVEEVALKRMTIYKESPCCAICGCCLELKTRSLSSDCPEHKWDDRRRRFIKMGRESLLMLDDQFKTQSEMVARQCLRTESDAFDEECQNYLHELWAEDIPEEKYLNFSF